MARVVRFVVPALCFGVALAIGGLARDILVQHPIAFLLVVVPMAVAAIAALVLRRNPSAAVIVVATWLGLAVGAILSAPESVGSDPHVTPESGTQRVQTALYRAELEIHQLPSSLLEATRPMETVIPQVRPLSGGRFLIVVSPQVFHISPSYREGEYDGTTYPTRSDMEQLQAVLAVVQLTDNGVEVLEQEELDDLQMVRGLALKGESLFTSSIRIHEGCVSIEVHRFMITHTPLTTSEPDLVFETEPCIDHEPISLHMAGGRLALAADELLLSVGDLNIPGSFQSETIAPSRPPDLAPPAHYGAVVALDLESGSATRIASGLRNPQGLTIDNSTGRVWVTDHGPGGGDELNLVTDGADFGWPQVSYGVPYGPPLPEGEWDTSRFGGHHDGFDLPTLVWTPAIAPSELLVYDGDAFELWQGDILVSSLRDQSLRRLRLHEDRVVYDERIPVDLRVRDVTVDEAGRIVLVGQHGEFAVLSPEVRERP